MSLVHFDVAVIGSELCALAAGAMLAHDHKKVVVIDDGETDESPLGEHLVPRAPTLWRLPTTGPAAELIEKLGLKQDARRVLGSPCGIAIVDDPDARLVIEPEKLRRQAEFERVFGSIGRQSSVALDEIRPEARDGLLIEATFLHEDGFFARRRTAKRRSDGGPALDPQSTDDAVRTLLASPLGPALPSVVAFVQHGAQREPGGVEGFLAAWLLHGGTVAHPSEGTSLRGALARRFIHTIEGHGGDVLRGVRVRTIDGDARRVTVVRTDDRNDYAVRAVIDGTEARSLTDRLPAGKGQRDTIEFQASAKRTGGAAIVRWLVDRSAIPRGLSSRTIVLPDAHAQLAPMVVAAYEGLPALDGRLPKVPSRIVAIVAAVKTTNDDATSETALRIEERLTSLMPFVEPHIVARDRLLGDSAWCALPSYLATGDANELGGCRPMTGFKNLARAGRDLAPRLGLEGEIAAAPAVAALVDEALGKKRLGAES
jgi:hypothetical protein